MPRIHGFLNYLDMSTSMKENFDFYKYLLGGTAVHSLGSLGEVSVFERAQTQMHQSLNNIRHNLTHIWLPQHGTKFYAVQREILKSSVSMAVPVGMQKNCGNIRCSRKVWAVVEKSMT